MLMVSAEDMDSLAGGGSHLLEHPWNTPFTRIPDTTNPNSLRNPTTMKPENHETRQPWYPRTLHPNSLLVLYPVYSIYPDYSIYSDLNTKRGKRSNHILLRRSCVTSLRNIPSGHPFATSLAWIGRATVGDTFLRDIRWLEYDALPEAKNSTTFLRDIPGEQ